MSPRPKVASLPAGVEKHGPGYRVRFRWGELGNFSVPCGELDLATDVAAALKLLKRHDRRDILTLIPAEISAMTVRARVTAQNAPYITVADLQSTAPRDGAPLISTLYEQWVRDMKTGKIQAKGRKTDFAPRTIAGYESKFTILRELLGTLEVPVTVLTEDFLSGYRSNRTRGAATDQTIDRDFTAFASFAGWVKAKKLAPSWEIPEFAFRGGADLAERWVPPAYVYGICEDLEKNGQGEYAHFFMALRSAGLRIDEMQKLRACDVDLQGMTVSLTPYLGHRLKSKHAARVVPIPESELPHWEAIQAPATKEQERPFLLEALREYHHVQGVFERACVRSGYHDGGTRHRYRIRREVALKNPKAKPRDLEAKIAAALEGVPMRKAPAFNLHSLRHSFGVACVKAGLQPEEIRQLMGHGDISTTSRYFRWAMRGDERATAGAKLSAVFGAEVQKQRTSQG